MNLKLKMLKICISEMFFFNSSIEIPKYYYILLKYDPLTIFYDYKRYAIHNYFYKFKLHTI